MTRTATGIFDDALQLSDQERANLAALLIASLDSTVDSDWESAWEVEIGRRITELDDGSVTTIPWSEVRKKLRDRLQARPND